MTDKIKPESTNWLKVAVGATVIYLLVVVRWIGTEKLVAFLKTDELNAFGDFLAGVFAPLAFLWLIAAVITQRQELNETRDQFEENQKVVDAQMETIKAQNELLALQNTQAQESARQTYKLNLFDQRFALYQELVTLHDEMAKGDIKASEWQTLHQLSKRSEYVFNQGVSDHLQSVLALCTDYFEYCEKHKDSWYVNPVEGGDFPTEKQHLDIRNRAIALRLSILECINMQSLGEIMGSSLRVSDE